MVHTPSDCQGEKVPTEESTLPTLDGHAAAAANDNNVALTSGRRVPPEPKLTGLVADQGKGQQSTIKGSAALTTRTSTRE